MWHLASVLPKKTDPMRSELDLGEQGLVWECPNVALLKTSIGEVVAISTIEMAGAKCLFQEFSDVISLFHVISPIRRSPLLSVPDTVISDKIRIS
jgi:hypothetical protein